MRQTSLILLMLIFPILATGQFVKNVSKAGTTAASFLEIGIGARAVSMGEAFVAVANDETAAYWNPAGLAKIENGIVGFHHIKWFADVGIDFGAVVFQIPGIGTLGASLSSLNMGEMKVRTVDAPEGTGERFDASDLVAGFSFARSLTDRFAIGATAKYIRQSIWHMAASAVVFDIGTMFEMPLRNLQLGMSISNFGTKMRLNGDDTIIYVDMAPEKYGSNNRLPAHLDTDSWSMPLNFRAGFAYDFLMNRGSRITLAIDALHPNNNTESVNIGGEFCLQELAFLRMGYKSLFIRDGEGGAAFGAGIKKQISGMVIRIDYSYVDYGRLQNAQRFSIGLSL